MPVSRSKLPLDHRRPFEKMANRQFLGDADTAMGLDGILADKSG
jgi:hypothetical protein